MATSTCPTCGGLLTQAPSGGPFYHPDGHERCRPVDELRRGCGHHSGFSDGCSWCLTALAEVKRRTGGRL